MHLNVSEACETLKMCQTSFKKLCRARGIERWPYKRQGKISVPATTLVCSGGDVGMIRPPGLQGTTPQTGRWQSGLVAVSQPQAASQTQWWPNVHSPGMVRHDQHNQVHSWPQEQAMSVMLPQAAHPLWVQNLQMVDYPIVAKSSHFVAANVAGRGSTPAPHAPTFRHVLVNTPEFPHCNSPTDWYIPSESPGWTATSGELNHGWNYFAGAARGAELGEGWNHRSVLQCQWSSQVAMPGGGDRLPKEDRLQPTEPRF